MPRWNFLTNQARALLFVARNPDCRVRDLADAIGVTERTAQGIVAELVDTGYVVKEKDGRRNHYQVDKRRPLPEARNGTTVGHVLALISRMEQTSGTPAAVPAGTKVTAPAR